MQSKTLLPVTALIALVAAAPLAWAQDVHDTSASPAGDDAKASSQAQDFAQPDNNMAVAAAQPGTICNDRNGTVACSIKSIPHEPEPAVPLANPSRQAPAPAQ